MRRGSLIPLLLITSLIVGCDRQHADSSSDLLETPIPSPTVAQAKDGKFTPGEVKGCAESGGRIVEMGMLQIQHCIHPLKDGGKACSDKSDCIGLCTTEDWPLDIGAKATGKCQADDGGQFGCYSEIDNGKVLRSICAD